MTDEEIYRKYADDLVRFATRLVGPFDAQEVVSDACLRAFRSRGWGDVANHRVYLYRSVLSQARSQHRSTLRRRLREMRSAPSGETPPVEANVDVLAAVNTLSVQQRATVVLTYWEDLGPGEVAARVGASERSVKRHLARARARPGSCSMSDHMDSKMRELTHRLIAMAPEAPPFPEELMVQLKPAPAEEPARRQRRPILWFAAGGYNRRSRCRPPAAAAWSRRRLRADSSPCRSRHRA
ncbi:MAG TPA: RNA polymerase sigma factor [Acidimicrobiia bacterium]|nr:RNA polymerase sigma factor [Acidimicrobiia bacterium]